MSKIGKKPIALTSAKISIQGDTVMIDGPKAKFQHVLPREVQVALEDKVLKVTIVNDTRKNRMMWGLHRVLLANKVTGAEIGFERKFTIVGLGYKALVTGKKVVFSLGYTHKIDYELPDGITLDVDKTGQQLTFRGSDKLMLGNVCSTIKAFRPPEPYKGTGIIEQGEVIIRKAGKTKS